MNILTDDEILAVMTPDAADGDYYLPQNFARAIEAAVLAKLAAKDVKPTAYITYKGHLLHADDPKVLEHSNPEPLYTEAQLIADQQRIAEACAKVCEANDTTHYPRSVVDEGFSTATAVCAEAIRNGEWRKYL